MKTLLILVLLFAVYMMYRDGKRCKDILAGNVNNGGTLPPTINWNEVTTPYNPTHGRCM